MLFCNAFSAGERAVPDSFCPVPDCRSGACGTVPGIPFSVLAPTVRDGVFCQSERSVGAVLTGQTMPTAGKASASQSADL